MVPSTTGLERTRSYPAARSLAPPQVSLDCELPMASPDRAPPARNRISLCPVPLDVGKVLQPTTLGKAVSIRPFHSAVLRFHVKKSALASAEAVIWGYEKVYYFAGGFPEWEEAGYPIAEGE